METGKFYEESFDKDELAALGEAETVPATEKAVQEKEPEIQDDVKTEEVTQKEETSTETKTETEQEKEPSPEEQAAAEEEGFQIETDEKGRKYIVDEDGTRIPPKRFKEIYREAKEGERTKEKFDLFKKLGPEGYYKAFPDETPEGYGATKETIPAVDDIGSMIVMQPGGPYDKMTLREVAEIDPVFATQLQTKHILEQERAERERLETETRFREEAKTEVETFAVNVAKEFFNKVPDKLSPEEEAKVGDVLNTVTMWMNKTHRGGGIITDAYNLMKMEGLIKGANTAASLKVIKSLTDKKGPASIDTSQGGDVQPTGFEAYEKMTEEALTKAIDGMTEIELVKFYKDAPKSLRQKYPSIPWD